MYRYRITVEALSENAENPSLQFTTENHDDIISIAQRLSGKFGLDEDGSKAFAIGLKLFGETVLKNREHPLFQGIKPALGDFMKELKRQA